MNQKRILATAIAGIALVSATTFSACKNDKETIEVSGSTSVSPLLGVLADSYMAENANVRINISEGGSAVGVSDAKAGKVDFGMVSKAVEEDGLTCVKIADDGIVVIVNKASELTNVTGGQLYDFYTAGTPIGTATLPVSRESGSGTRDAFEELVKNADGKKLKESETFATNMQQLGTTGATITAVGGNVAALGYISLGAFDETTVKKVSFDGVEGNVENIKNGSYKLSRPFNLLYSTANGLSESAQAFLDFILSEEGQRIIAEEGYITVL